MQFPFARSEPPAVGDPVRHARGKAFLLGLATLLFLLAGAEAALRIALPAREKQAMLLPGESLIVRDATLRWIQRESSEGSLGFYVRTNSLGLRGDSFPEERDGRPVRRVLVLGNSPAWGHGIDQHLIWSELLEGDLERLLPAFQVDVLNAAVPGYSTAQSLEQARRLMDRFHFDVVLVTNQGSDMFPAASPDEDCGPVGWELSLGRLFGRSRLVEALWARTAGVERDRLQEAQVRTALIHGFGEDSWSHFRVPARPAYAENLRAMAGMTRRQGSEPVFVQPLPLCASSPCGEFAPSAQPHHRALFERMQQVEPDYRRVMAEVAASEGVGLVDLAELLSAVGEPAGLLIDETHPSALGHDLIARTLGPVLVPMLISRLDTDGHGAEGAPSRPRERR